MGVGVNAGGGVNTQGRVTPGNSPVFVDAQTLQDGGAAAVQGMQATISSAQLLAGAPVLLIPAPGPGR